MKSALFAAAVAATALGAGNAAAESNFTYISPSIILMGEPAPEEKHDADEAEISEPMPRVITGATETEEADVEENAAEDNAPAASPDEQTGAIAEPPVENETARSVVPPPETTDTLRGPIIPAPPPANSVERMQE